jgi:nitric oxide reductase subunit C
VISSCGGDESVQVVGDASKGEELYKQKVIGSSGTPGCITCHSLEEGVTVVGPSHAGIAARVEESGLQVEDYLRTSIVDPNAVIAEGFSEGVMYQNYATDLTSEQIDDLVAFLMTLK